MISLVIKRRNLITYNNLLDDELIVSDMNIDNLKINVNIGIVENGHFVQKEEKIELQNSEINQEIHYSFPTATVFENEFIVLSE